MLIRQSKSLTNSMETTISHWLSRVKTFQEEHPGIHGIFERQRVLCNEIVEKQSCRYFDLYRVDVTQKIPSSILETKCKNYLKTNEDFESFRVHASQLTLTEILYDAFLKSNTSVNVKEDTELPTSDQESEEQGSNTEEETNQERHIEEGFLEEALDGIDIPKDIDPYKVEVSDIADNLHEFLAEQNESVEVAIDKTESDATQETSHEQITHGTRNDLEELIDELDIPKDLDCYKIDVSHLNENLYEYTDKRDAEVKEILPLDEKESILVQAISYEAYGPVTFDESELNINVRDEKPRDQSETSLDVQSQKEDSNETEPTQSEDEIPSVDWNDLEDVTDVEPNLDEMPSDEFASDDETLIDESELVDCEKNFSYIYYKEFPHENDLTDPYETSSDGSSTKTFTNVEEDLQLDLQFDFNVEKNAKLEMLLDDLHLDFGHIRINPLCLENLQKTIQKKLPTFLKPESGRIAIDKINLKVPEIDEEAIEVFVNKDAKFPWFNLDMRVTQATWWGSIVHRTKQLYYRFIIPDHEKSFQSATATVDPQEEVESFKSVRQVLKNFLADEDLSKNSEYVGCVTKLVGKLDETIQHLETKLELCIEKAQKEKDSPNFTENYGNSSNIGEKCENSLNFPENFGNGPSIGENCRNSVNILKKCQTQLALNHHSWESMLQETQVYFVSPSPDYKKSIHNINSVLDPQKEVDNFKNVRQVLKDFLGDEQLSRSSEHIDTQNICNLVKRLEKTISSLERSKHSPKNPEDSPNTGGTSKHCPNCQKNPTDGPTGGTGKTPTVPNQNLPGKPHRRTSGLPVPNYRVRRDK
ncbi:hypothetical protein M8J75_007133 [Diaphorina citri]|nr:hypothetical protein M8J75_007133 [Diaphorina citri]